MKKYLIVNADDMGRTKDINNGILLAYKKGIVSSTTLVANSNAYNHAVNILKKEPNLNVGIHLALHEYEPIKKTIFLNKLKKLRGLKLYIRLLFLSKKELLDIEDNFKLQIEKILNSGIVPSHIDGHNHLYLHPKLAKILKKILKKYKFKCLRLPNEKKSPSLTFRSLLKKYLLKIISLLTLLNLRNDKIVYPEYFHGLSNGGDLNYKILNKILSDCVCEGTNELMCHVGKKQEDPPYNIGYNFQKELKAIIQYNKEDLKKNFNITVISYKDLINLK